MFHTVEKFRTPAKVILGLVALSLVGFGAFSLRDVSASTQKAPNIVSIGDTLVTEEEINDFLKKQQIPVTDDVKQQVYLYLVRQAYLIEGAKLLGVKPSDEELIKKLKEAIQKDPEFLENGAFKQAKFDEFLKKQRLTEAQFTQNIINGWKKAGYLEQSFLLFGLFNQGEGNPGVVPGPIVSDAQVLRFLKLQMTTKQAYSHAFLAEKYLDQVKYTDKDLLSFYETNKDAFAQQEAVKFDVLGFAPNQLKNTAKIVVTDADITASAGERHAAHILIKFPENADDKAKAEAKKQAEKVLAEVKANPEQFAELARKYSADTGSASSGGDLGFFKKGTMVPSFEQKTFSMAKGEISDLVESPYGYHIIKLIDTKTGEIKAEEKEQIRENLKNAKLRELMMAEVAKLQEFVGKPNSEFAAAAKKMGLGITSNNFTTREELARTGFQPESIEALFSDDVVKNKKISPIVENTNLVVIAMAKEVRPYKLLSFEEAKAEVIKAYKFQEAQKLAQDAAKQAMDKLKKGENVAGVEWGKDVQDITPQSMTGFQDEAVKSILTAKGSAEKPSYAMSAVPGGAVLIKIVGEKQADDKQVEAMLPQARGFLNGMNANNNIIVYLKYLSTVLKEIPGTQPSPMVSAVNAQKASGTATSAQSEQASQ